MTLTLGVDIGGTKVAVGVVDQSGQVLTKMRRPIAANDAAATLSDIVDMTAHFRAKHEMRAIGIGVPGLLDASRSRVVFAANLGWVDVPVREVIETHTELPTVLEDDANAAAWAEYRFGAGRNEPHLVMVTVGTGLGGGIIDDGTIRHGASGAAADIGHIQLVPDGFECGCGRQGCLEQYASGRALLREVRDRCTDQPSQASLVLSLGDGTLQGIRGEHVTEAARLGDPLAVQSFEKIASSLGVGLAILAAVLDPGCFVLGGGVSEAGSLLLEPSEASYRRSLPAGKHRSPARLKLAELGNNAGIIGAADLARQPRGGLTAGH